MKTTVVGIGAASLGRAELVSIVIPCYNNAAYVRDAIESALCQTYRNVQVVVVNDGSTDHSRRIIDEYRDQVAIIDQANSGACAARNAGLSAAAGRWVKFLDADDVLIPDCLEKQVPIAEPAGIVFGDLELIDAIGNIKPHKPHSQTSGLSRGDCATLATFINSPVLISTTLYPTKLLQRAGGFNVQVRRGQEHELHLRLYLSGVDFRYYPQTCFQYRQHDSPTRLSVSRRRESHFAMIQNFAWLIERVENGPRAQERERNYLTLGQSAWRIGRRHLRNDDIAQAQAFFSEARRLAGSGAVWGSKSYRFITALGGPIFAETVGARVTALRGRRNERDQND